MERNKVVIVGAGLGGLECGYILAKCGMDVTVLERQHQPGGCMQSFLRGGSEFDTGMHYVGSLGEGESLNALFSYFGLMSLPWVQLDKDCFDEVVIGDESFRYASGYWDFVNVLGDRFPRERTGLIKYANVLKRVGDNIFGVLEPSGGKAFDEGSLFSRSAYDFLCETIGNPLLRKVLSGTSLKMELNPDSLPLYTFAQINDSFIRSAWRLSGGGSMIAESLAESIRGMGGAVRTGVEVIEIHEDSGGVTGVTVAGGEFVPADYVISNAHPAVTVGLLGEDSRMRKAYRRRVSALENTVGMFTVNIRLKPETLEYRNRNLYIHGKRTDLWSPSGNAVNNVMVSWPVPRSGGRFAESLDILTPMNISDVAKWSGTTVGQRGEDYAQFKKQTAWKCFKLVEKQLPQIWESVDKVYTSTPLTWRDYNLSPNGSAYGIRKDWRDPMQTFLAPKTPVQGLLLTGQSLNLHGVLGVSMTSLLTCAEIVGMDKIRIEIKPFLE